MLVRSLLGVLHVTLVYSCVDAGTSCLNGGMLLCVALVYVEGVELALEMRL